MHPLTPAPQPFDRWGIDFIGELPITKNGNRWILMAVDYATNWPVAKAVPDASEKTVAEFIYKEIFMNYGCPVEILSDRGAQFMAKTLDIYLRQQNIKHLTTSAYHPRTNGKTERTNGVFKKIITKHVGNHMRHKWDLFVEQALFDCRIRTHSVTKYSPFRLIYGREPRIPGDTIRPYLWDLKDKQDLYDHTERELLALQGDRRIAELRQKDASQLMAERYNKKHGIDPDELTKEFKQGDLVLLKNYTAKKYEFKWTGPYEIVRPMPFGTYQLKLSDGTIKNDLVHLDRLKLRM